MSDIVVEKGVPAPEPREYVLRLTDADKQAILAMKPGESFVTDIYRARSAWAFAKRNGFRLVQAKYGNGNVRVWRTEENHVG